MSALHFGTYGLKLNFPDLSYGCCSANVCAVVLDRFGNGLKKISTSPDVWALASYTKTTHSNFCIQLNEHAQRAFYYYLDMEDESYTLPSNSPGDCYKVEYWYRITTDNNYDRESDALLDVQDLKWDGVSKTMIDHLISSNQMAEMSQTIPIASIAYDKSNQTARILCWLNRNGVLLEDSQSATITWRRFDGTLVAEVVNSSFMNDSEGAPIPGIFDFELTGINITPDMANPFILEMLDANSNSFKSNTSVVSYD